MANLIMTNKCNLQCPFCFAEQKKTYDNTFSVSDVWKTIKFITGNTVRFCGGEPTLNPNIIDISDCVLENGLNILFMTNGMWPNSFLEYYKNIPFNKKNRINFLFNILESNFYSKKQKTILIQTLTNIYPLKTTLGLTIDKENYDYSYIFKLCESFSIPSIRLSIAAPKQLDNFNQNIYLLYKELSSLILNFLIEAKN